MMTMLMTILSTNNYNEDHVNVDNDCEQMMTKNKFPTQPGDKSDIF